jgi:hypothetical protein
MLSRRVSRLLRQAVPMPAYSNPPRDPAILTTEWQPTGRSRLRTTWFGIVIAETEQTAMVRTVGTAAPLQGWRLLKRWRRARRGHVVTLGSEVLRAFLAGKADRLRSRHAIGPDPASRTVDT